MKIKMARLLLVILFLGVTEAAYGMSSDTGKSLKMETWSKTYGGVNIDSANSVQQTSDGGYIVAGSTSYFEAGKPDAWYSSR